MMPYERFKAWQLCHGLALNVYRVTKKYPAVERYGLTSQTRRAAFSAPANIAEGSAKRGNREFRRFLDVALGSLTEVSYWLRAGRDLDILSAEDWQLLDQLRERASQATWGLYHSMSRPPADRLTA
jgi:four helix bundle protein